MAAAAEAAAIAAIAYTGVAIARAARFAQRGTEGGQQRPPVTLLIPLHGAEPGLEENLRSLADQDYPEYQVVLGVARADDAALPIARRVAAALPGRCIEIDIGERAGTRNPKLANVISMMRLARHGVLVLCDSDTRVDASYLSEVVAPLEDPAVGLVTCLFAGVPQEETSAAKLGAAFINDQFIPSALVEGLFGPLRHGFGPTNAMRAEVLESIGGFEALGVHLADDFMLGHEIAARGLRVVLSKYVLHTIVSDPSTAALFRHELRWHRTIRGVRPAGYAGMFLTYPVPLAVFNLALSQNRARAAALLVLASAGRMALQRVASRALGVEPAGPWLALARDFFGLAVWVSGLFGSSVHWRGDKLQIAAGDVLAPAESRGDDGPPAP